MIHADDRRSLSHPVTLNNCKTQSLPELFHVSAQFGAARDEGPEFPTKQLMSVPKSPPTDEHVCRTRTVEIAAKSVELRPTFVATFNLFAQGLQCSWYADND